MTKPTRPPPAPLVVYPWGTAPEWAKWAATDAGGYFCWYSHRPFRHATEQIWMRNLKAPGHGQFEWGSQRKPCPYWRHTLQARPSPKKPKPQPAPGKRRKVRMPPVIKFLLGEGSLDGVWYGAGAPSGRGPYWWRKKLRAAIGRLPIGRGRGGK